MVLVVWTPFGSSRSSERRLLLTFLLRRLQPSLLVQGCLYDVLLLAHVSQVEPYVRLICEEIVVRGTYTPFGSKELYCV